MTYRNLVTHTFKGSRFDDHALDLDVLPELVTYKTILVEVAKELWRTKHPEKQRLPKNFEDEFSLKILALEDGSVGVPILRAKSPGKLFEVPDELDEALELVTETIECAEQNRKLPENFPKKLLYLFQNYGTTLREDESFQYKTAKSQKVTSYTTYAREELLRRMEDTYQDCVDVCGKVIMARVDKPRLALLLDTGQELEAPFDVADEGKIISALARHENSRIKLRGQAIFKATGQIQRFISVEVIDLLSRPPIEEYTRGSKPIWEQIEELAHGAPPGVFDNLPKDGASHHNRELYGKGN
jgi:hypothetical protein